MPSRSRWSAALFAFLLFALGAAVGALGDRYYNETTVRARPSPEDFRRRYVSDMESRLKLTPAQVTQLQAVMDDTRAKFHALHESRRPEVEKIREDHQRRVRAILSPEQATIYDRFIAEHDRHDAHR